MRELQASTPEFSASQTDPNGPVRVVLGPKRRGHVRG